MATFNCVMFGQILYDDNLTYQELLATEQNVKLVVQDTLQKFGAQHFDFTPQADSLLLECLLPVMERQVSRSICDAINRQLGPQVLARFEFVDRQMNNTVFYFLGRGKWQEQVLNIPGPKQALSGWVVRQERKTINPQRVVIKKKT